MPSQNNSLESKQEFAFCRHRENFDVDIARSAKDQAEEEWEKVVTVEPLYQPNFFSVSHVSYQQAFNYFQSLDLSQYMDEINVEVERKGLCTLLNCLRGPPHLDDHLYAERDLIFAIAKCKLDIQDSMHIRILQTIYYRFTGTNFGCSCYGSHWEHIGFQGRDPGSDLRGVGMLGLLQLLYLTTNPKLSQLSHHIYRVSVDVSQSFPLAILSFNLTRVALQALRHGQLNRECNERQQIVDVLNEFYVAVFLHLLNIWTSQHKTIKDSGFVLKEVEWYCRSNVRLVFKNLQMHINATDQPQVDKLCLLESFNDLKNQAKSEVFI